MSFTILFATFIHKYKSNEDNDNMNTYVHWLHSVNIKNNRIIYIYPQHFMKTAINKY